MQDNAPSPKSQASFSNGPEHTTTLEQVAASLGRSPWWVKRWLGQRGQSLAAFVTSGNFRALQRERRDFEARAHALLLEGPDRRRAQSNGKAEPAATNGQAPTPSVPQPARPRSRSGGATPAAAAAVPARALADRGQP
jgi:hypothetical protein